MTLKCIWIPFVLPEITVYHLVFLHFSFCSIGRKNARKRLSQEQVPDDVGQEPEVSGTHGSPAVEGHVLPSEVPLIQPKAEPEELESKWTDSYNMTCSLFSFLRDSFCNLVTQFGLCSLCSAGQSGGGGGGDGEPH